ncbi:MAG: hypothetical protein ACP5UM_11245, partial [Anaerolineae bacterium]
ALAGQGCRLSLPGGRDLLLPRWEAPLARPFRLVSPQAESAPAAEWRLYVGDALRLQEPLTVQCEAGQGRAP